MWKVLGLLKYMLSQCELIEICPPSKDNFEISLNILGTLVFYKFVKVFFKKIIAWHCF